MKEQMKSECVHCSGTGITETGYLDCGHCNAASKRAALGKWAVATFGHRSVASDDMLWAAYQLGCADSSLAAEVDATQRVNYAINETITSMSVLHDNAVSKALEEKEAEIKELHLKLAAETLRADAGWSRYESANADRNALRGNTMQPNIKQESH